MVELFLSTDFFSLEHCELYNSRDFLEALRRICGRYICSYDGLLISFLFIFISHFLEVTLFYHISFPF